MMDVDTSKEFKAARSQTSKSSKESDLQTLKTSMPTIYPNDYDFNAIAGFGFNSTTSRSFVRPPKSIGQEHRNISVPNSLKVCSCKHQLFLFILKLKLEHFKFSFVLDKSFLFSYFF